jgi:Na+-driven multidrug efflux pump
MGQIPCIVIFYAIGIPLGSILAFKTSMGGAGLVFGIIIAQTLLNCYYLHLIWYKLDWDVVTQEILKRR